MEGQREPVTKEREGEEREGKRWRMSGRKKEK